MAQPRPSIAQEGGAQFYQEGGAQGLEELGPEEEVESGPDARIQVAVTYTIDAKGRLKCGWEVDATRALPARLPPNLFKSGPFPQSLYFILHF